MHSLDLSIITPYATKTFLNVRQALQIYSLESSCMAQASGPHHGPPLPLPGFSLPFYLGRGSAWIALLQLFRFQNCEYQDSILRNMFTWYLHNCLSSPENACNGSLSPGE